MATPGIILKKKKITRKNFNRLNGFVIGKKILGHQYNQCVVWEPVNNWIITLSDHWMYF